MKVEYPEFTGRYKVGVTEFIVDTGREETLKLHEGGVRKLSCRMYYPSTAEGIEGKERSEYMSRQLCKAYKADYDKKMADDRQRYNALDHCTGKPVRILYKVLTENTAFKLS